MFKTFTYDPDRERWKIVLKKSGSIQKTTIFAGDYERLTEGNLSINYMEIYELSQGEKFLIETIREFRFLSAYRYDGSGFVIAGREYSVTFTNYSSSRSITIIWEETQELNVIFEKKGFWGINTQNLNNIAKFKRNPTSIKTLAELVQSNYMYLVIDL